MTSSAPITFINETTQSVANTVSPNTVAAPTTAMKPSTATTELSTSPAPSSSPASPSPSTVTINNNSSNNINESNCNSNGPASFPEKGRWTEAREIQFLKSYSETAPFAAGYGFTNAAWNKVLKEVNAVDREEPSLTYGSLRRKITSLYKKYIPSGAVLGTLPVLDKPNPTFEQLVVRVWYTEEKARLGPGSTTRWAAVNSNKRPHAMIGEDSDNQQQQPHYFRSMAGGGTNAATPTDTYYYQHHRPLLAPRPPLPPPSVATEQIHHTTIEEENRQRMMMDEHRQHYGVIEEESRKKRGDFERRMLETMDAIKTISQAVQENTKMTTVAIRDTIIAIQRNTTETREMKEALMNFLARPPVQSYSASTLPPQQQQQPPPLHPPQIQGDYCYPSGYYYPPPPHFSYPWQYPGQYHANSQRHPTNGQHSPLIQHHFNPHHQPYVYPNQPHHYPPVGFLHQPPSQLPPQTQSSASQPSPVVHQVSKPKTQKQQASNDTPPSLASPKQQHQQPINALSSATDPTDSPAHPSIPTPPTVFPVTEPAVALPSSSTVTTSPIKL